MIKVNTLLDHWVKSQYSKISYHNLLTIALTNFCPYLVLSLSLLPKIKINTSQNLNEKCFDYWFLIIIYDVFIYVYSYKPWRIAYINGITYICN